VATLKSDMDCFYETKIIFWKKPYVHVTKDGFSMKNNHQTLQDSPEIRTLPKEKNDYNDNSVVI
jgi:hypothetical protein